MDDGVRVRMLQAASAEDVSYYVERLKLVRLLSDFAAYPDRATLLRRGGVYPRVCLSLK